MRSLLQFIIRNFELSESGVQRPGNEEIKLTVSSEDAGLLRIDFRGEFFYISIEELESILKKFKDAK